MSNEILSDPGSVQVKGPRSISLDTHKAEASEVLRWLTQEDPHAKQREAASKRLPGTSRWFLMSPIFNRWLINEHQTLFCPGAPGSGKTMIASMVVDKLIDSFQADPTIGIAYFYCSWQQEDQRTERLLGSIVQQLGCRLQSMPSSLLDLYQHHSTKATHPSITELFDVLKTVVARMSEVYLIIDALDELSSTSRRALLPRLFTMQSTARVNILGTSRPLPDIVSRFENYPSLDLSGEDIDQDIRRYIDESMPKLPA
jgi:Cdc6-like AAA superfamily ATPase